ncbi:USP6 N-terminal-like protein [Vulpes lagopus]
MGQGAARSQPPQGQETSPGDPARRQMDKNAQAMRPLPPQREAVEMKEEALVSSWDITQIDLDVNRTFHSHTMFWDCYGAGADLQRALFTVLSAYSMYDTMSEVGYCQGMSEIVAILLMFLPEEDAFWALAQLMTDNRHAMHGFPKLPRFQAHHKHVLDRALPKLKKHMDEEQMCTGIYTPKWFLQCFIDLTPFSLTLKLWDAYILDGECMLTAMTYTIFKVHRKRLLKLPLEGPREFLQDSLAQPWALEEKVVLRHLRASMTQLRRMKCDLPSPVSAILGPKLKL